MPTKILLLFIIMFIGHFKASAQPNPQVFDYSSFVWFGLDFSNSQLIGSSGFTNPQDITARYLKAWNNLILNERDKYHLGEFYKMGWKQTELGIVSRRNETVDPAKLVIDMPYKIDPAAIDEIIGNYHNDTITEGLGLVYIVESFNKMDLSGNIYVVFFDISSKQLLWKEKYFGRPRGFGIRNYWAGSILNIMKASGSDFNNARKAARK